jgi:hypothetical protein
MIESVKEDPKDLALVLNSALRRGWELFECCVDNPTHEGSRMDNWDGALFILESKAKLGFYHSAATDAAAVRLVAGWSVLSQMDLKKSSKDITQSKPFVTMINQTKYLAYCIDWTHCTGKRPPLFDASVFSAFWQKMEGAFLDAPSDRKTVVLDVLNICLEKAEYCACRIAVSRQMDSFYMMLEDARDKAQNEGKDSEKLVNALDVCNFSLFDLGSSVR